MGKWDEFKDPSYEITDMGRPGVFLIPSAKLRQVKIEGKTVEEHLHEYLGKTFSAFTYSPVPTAGFWLNGGCLEYDECRRYEVAFNGKDKIPGFLLELTRIARTLGEKCFYVKAGQYACLLTPT